MLNQIFLQAG